MKIEKVEKLKDRKFYIDLFLIGDEDLNMLNKYINLGDMYIIFDNGLKGGIILLEKSCDTLEIKNISVGEEDQGKGYGTRLVNYSFKKYKGKYRRIIVGTGDSPLTLPFYKSLGFRQYFVVKDFFLKNYREKIVEAGVVLKDMVYLEKYL